MPDTRGWWVSDIDQDDTHFLLISSSTLPSAGPLSKRRRLPVPASLASSAAMRALNTNSRWHLMRSFSLSPVEVSASPRISAFFALMSSASAGGTDRYVPEFVLSATEGKREPSSRVAVKPSRGPRETEVAVKVPEGAAVRKVPLGRVSLRPHGAGLPANCDADHVVGTDMLLAR